MTFRAVFSLILVIFAAAPAHAQDEDGLSGRIAFGYLATTGNSESENLNLTFSGAHDAAPWHHSLDGLAVKASSGGIDTAEAYGLVWQTKWDLNEASYLFGVAAWNKDKFSAYDQQLREVFGYGRRFINRERHRLNGEAGVGFRQADLRDGTSEDEGIVRLAADYRWLITETSSFTQLFAIDSGSANTYTEAVSSLRTSVWQNIGLVLSYTVRRNTDVPVGTEKRDTFTAVSIEYSF